MTLMRRRKTENPGAELWKYDGYNKGALSKRCKVVVEWGEGDLGVSAGCSLSSSSADS